MIGGRKKSHNSCRNRSKFRPCWATVYQKVEIFAILEVVYPRAPIVVKFCTAKRTNVPLRGAKFHVNLCDESPLRGENADFRHVSKFTG